MLWINGGPAMSRADHIQLWRVVVVDILEGHCRVCPAGVAIQAHFRVGRQLFVGNGCANAVGDDLASVLVRNKGRFGAARGNRERSQRCAAIVSDDIRDLYNDVNIYSPFVVGKHHIEALRQCPRNKDRPFGVGCKRSWRARAGYISPRWGT